MERIMSTRRIVTSNNTAFYLIAIVIIIGAFLLLGGGPWIKSLMHGGNSLGMAHWNWAQILISLGLGFLLGLVVAKRKW
jgi:hypothetical protein